MQCNNRSIRTNEMFQFLTDKQINRLVVLILVFVVLASSTHQHAAVALVSSLKVPNGHVPLADATLRFFTAAPIQCRRVGWRFRITW